MDLKINLDIAPLLKKFDPQTQINMQRNIINKLGRMAKKQTKQSILSKYNLKSGEINIKITAARKSNLTCKLSARKKELSLTRFNPQQTMQGSTVQVIKGQTTYIEGAFVRQPHGRDWSKYGQKGTVTSKYQMVFMRKGRSPYPFIQQKELKEQYSISIGKILKSSENMNAINAMMARERGAVEKFIVDNWTNKKLSQFMNKPDEE